MLYMDNFAVLEGSITISASSTKTISISYPTSFSKTNSAVISTGLILKDDTNGKGYNYDGFYEGSSDLLNNAFKRRVNLTNDNVKLYVKNPNTAEQVVLQYRIVLMKVK